MTISRNQSVDCVSPGQLFEQLAHHFSGMLYVCQPDDLAQLCYCSEGCIALFGLTPEQLLEQQIGFFSLIDEHDRAVIQKTKRELLHTQHRYFGEYRIMRSDGLVLWVQDQACAVRNDLGEITAIEGFITDISSRKEQNQALIESQQQLQTLFNNSPDMQFSIDPYNKKVLNCNQTLLNTLGYYVHEVIGESVLNLYTPESGLRVIEELLPQFLAQGQLDGVELQVAAKDHSILDVLLSSRAVRNATGEITHTISSWRNITAQKQLQRLEQQNALRFKQLFDALPIPCAINSPDLKISYLNKAFVDTFGYTKDDIPDLARWWPLAYPEENYRTWVLDEWQTRLKNTQNNGQNFEGLLVKIRCKNANIKTVLAGAVPLNDDWSGDHLVTLIDLSEQENQQQTLIEREKNYRTLFETANISIWKEDLSAVLERLDELRQQGVECLADYLAQDTSRVLEFVHLFKVTDINPATEILFEGHRDVLMQDIGQLFAEGALEVIKSELLHFWEKKPYFSTGVNLKTLSGHPIQAIISFPVPTSIETSRNVPVCIQDLSSVRKLQNEVNLQNEVLENMNQGVNLVNASTGIIVYCNPTLEKMFGYEADELIGKPISILNADEGQGVASEIFNILQQQQHWEGEIANQRKSGEKFWTRAAISGFNHQDYGQVWVTVQRDVTEEYIAKQALEINQHQLQAIAQIQGNFIENQNEKLAFDTVLAQVCLVAKCEFGFIAEVLYKADGKPFLRANALSNIAWDEQSNTQYRQYIEGKFEFHNLDSLFGAGLKSGAPFISNDAANDPHSCGTPHGHPRINNFMSIPIFEGNEIIAEIGMANRKDGFDLGLIDQLNPIMLTYSQLIMAIRSRRESRKAKEELRLRDQLWKSAIEGAGHGVWDWDLTNNKLLLTEKWATLLGYTIDELSDSPATWFELVHPDDIAILRNQLQSHLEGKSDLFSYEYRLRCKNGEYKWVLSSGKVILRDTQKTALRMIGTNTDINQRKGAEEELLANRAQLAGMIDSAMDAIITTDSNFNIILFNHAAEQMFGYPIYKMLGCPIEALIPGRFAVAHHAYMKQFAQSGTQTRKMSGHASRQVYGLRSDGVEFPIEVAISYSDNYGSPIFTAMVRDITERKNYEQSLLTLTTTLEERVQQRTLELENARVAAESANKAKSAFVANMSHEIRTPLNSVLGMAHLALQTNLNDKQRDYLNKISISGRHLLELINDILDFSKIEAGKLEIESTEFSIANLCNEIKNILEPKAHEKQLSFDVVIDSRITGHVQGDELRIKQVLLNLLSNAIKFTQTGGIKLSVAIKDANSQTPLTSFTVTDTGIGISPVAQTKLFQSFQQADNSTTRKFGGTGLGLAISRQLVELMGGELHLFSQLNSGSEFSFCLRLPSVKASISTQIDNEVGDYRSVLLGKRVLLADDHPFNQQVGEDMLAAVGVSVMLANNGQEAVELAQTQQFDAILMDVQMPGMDGFTATRLLRENDQLATLPIIAMTANVSSQDREQCLQAGMNDFVAKPVIPEKLYKTLAYWLAGIANKGVDEDTQSKSENSWIDLAVLESMLGSDRARQKNYFAKFVTALTEGLGKITKLLASNELAQIGAECHRLKSVARTVGAIKLGDSLQSLEAKDSIVTRDIAQIKLKELNLVFQQTCQDLFNLQLIEQLPCLPCLETQTLVDPNLHVMVIDDDEFTLDLLVQQLTDLQLTHITSCLDAQAALAQLEDEAPPDWILCDLQMPDMDGIAFLRLLGQKNYRGQVAILSGLDSTVLKATEKLGQSFQLNIHGALSKPVKKEVLANLLSSEHIKHSPRSAAKIATTVDLLDANELRHGLAHGAIELHYQPKVSTHDHRVVGAECLARWRHPTRGLLGPHLFISAIETLGLIDNLTFNVLQQAVKQLKQWQEQGEFIKLSVNVSMNNLHQLELPELFAEVLAENGIAPQSITLEVTETQLTHDYYLSLDILTRLRIKGFGLSIDDFGTGFSTMEHLMQTPFTELKIDQAFVRGASSDHSAQTILEHSVMLGTKFQLNLVAEGVETQEDWDLVVSAGCHEVQGYLVAKPMPADEFIAWKKHWESTPHQ